MKLYDGILRTPFLFEHWHKGFAAALALWLPLFSLAAWGKLDTHTAAWVATAGSCVVALSVFTYREGFTLDPARGRYRNYIWVAGMRFGKWQTLPPLAGILLMPYEYAHSLPLTARSNLTQLGLVAKVGSVVKGDLIAREYKWQVLLRVINSPIGITAACVGYKEALRSAERLGELLGLEVVVRQTKG